MQPAAKKRQLFVQRTQHVLATWSAAQDALLTRVGAACEVLRSLSRADDEALSRVLGDAKLRELAKLRQLEALDAALQSAADEARYLRRVHSATRADSRAPAAAHAGTCRRQPGEARSRRAGRLCQRDALLCGRAWNRELDRGAAPARRERPASDASARQASQDLLRIHRDELALKVRAWTRACRAVA